MTARVILTAILLFWLSLSEICTPQNRVTAVVTIPVETILEADDSSSTVEAWLEMICSARRTIDLAEFYLASRAGERLEEVITALLQKARQGINVRVLAEKKMAAVYPEVLARLTATSGIAVRLFDWQELNGGILHAKYLIVDGRECFVGSQNFDWRSLKHIHETGLRVRDTRICAALSAIFTADWDYSGGDRSAYEKLKLAKPYPFDPALRLTASPAPFLPPGVMPSLKALTELIEDAQQEITVQLLTYTTEDGRFSTLADALKRAATRGVRVRMLIADWNLRPEGLVGLRRLARIEGVEVRVAAIPPAREGFIPYARVIHSKVMRVDRDRCWLGTSNWGEDYFQRSRNIELIVESASLAVVLDGLFRSLWESPYVSRFDPDRAYEAPRIAA